MDGYSTSIYSTFTLKCTHTHTHTATFVVDRAIEKLGVDVDRLGFDNETVMVEALGLLREPISRGCFRKGAGKEEMRERERLQILTTNSPS